MFLSATEPERRELNADGGHWYKPDGSPCHTVPKADGSGDRPTNLADARRLGLLPSVTSITGVISNPSLERWKQERLLQACIDNPIESGESLDRYAVRVKRIAQKRMVDARAFGSALHSALEDLHQYGFVGENHKPMLEWLRFYLTWTRENKVQVGQVEQVCVNLEIGYAGQLDAVATVNGLVSLIDFKSQSVTAPEGKPLKPTFYPSWGWQLAAYKNASWEHKPTRINQVLSVVFNSEEPGPPWVKKWTPEELRESWKAFRHSARIWQAVSRYTPALRQQEEAA